MFVVIRRRLKLSPKIPLKFSFLFFTKVSLSDLLFQCFHNRLKKRLNVKKN